MGYKLPILNTLRVASALALLLAAVTTSAQNEAAPEDLEFFEKQVRPVLAQHCFECHGPETQKSDLRLDHISTILTGGSRGPALTPGDSKTSRMIEAISYGNVKLQMPPKGKLPDDAIADLTEWIRRGAPWPDEPAPDASVKTELFDLAARAASHWAWQPIAEVEVPEVAQADWSSHPADRFLLAKLEAKGLHPALDADRRTLARRLYFDLIGLPPTPAEVESFAGDESPDAYEKLVDTLLESPHFGERWGRHWLDLVRFAETYGHEQDYPIRHAWKYRDYVIRAFNEDVPYNTLVREHIAGDLLERPRLNPDEGFNEAVIGTGFWYLHQATHGPVDVAQDEADRIDNQIDVMGKAFLGMTVACARCHDHKFDAISTKDYYALTGFMRSSRQTFAYLDPTGRIGAATAGAAEVQSEGSAILRGAFAANADSVAATVAKYLEASDAVMNGVWSEADGPITARDDIVFDDFESGNFDRWTVEGESFSTKPASEALEGQQRVTGIRGNGFANSFHGGDNPEGKLTSQPFLIERSFIRFLIGGGDVDGRTCVNLKVFDETVRSATGKKREALEPALWDVSEYVGLRGVIEIVDNHSGGWGHINLDHIVFSDIPFFDPIQRPVSAVAAEHDVDPVRLTEWVKQIQSVDANAAAHPLHAWRALTAGGADKIEANLAGLRTASETAEQPNAILFEDFDAFDDATYADRGWFSSGFAFGDRPARSGELDVTKKVSTVVPSNAAHSGLLAKPLQGTLRSPTFTITHDRVHYRVRGERARIRLVIGQFQLREFNPLLFDGTLSDVNTGGETIWITQHQGIGKFKGQSAYIELIDDGDGYIAVDSIWFSDDAEPPTGANATTRAALANLESANDRSVHGLANAYAAILRSEMQSDQGSTPQIASWLMSNQLLELGDTGEQVAALDDRRNASVLDVPEPVRVLAATEGTPTEAAVFIRGSHLSVGDETPRRFLAAIAGPEQPAVNGGSGRLELADRLLADDNPLPARVMANRVWHHLMGRGIVASVDDFGVLGEAPTHPELLDHLAKWFKDDNDWSIKGLIKYIVTTRAYQMSSAPSDENAVQIDPSNALLHRMHVKRLEGEAVRDAILACSGSLDKTMFGESVPIYLSPFMGESRRPNRSGPEDGDHRRTIYVEIRRNFLSPMQLAFDYPIPDSTIGRRTSSNVPAQALILMNDPFVVGEARHWGAQLAAEEGVDRASRIRHIFMTALSRPPTDLEARNLDSFIADQAAVYGLDNAAIDADPRIWTDVCHIMFTLKEFIFVS